MINDDNYSRGFTDGKIDGFRSGFECGYERAINILQVVYNRDGARLLKELETFIHKKHIEEN